MASSSCDKDEYNLDFLPKDQSDKLKKMYSPEFFQNPKTLWVFREFNMADRLLQRQPGDSLLAAPLMQVFCVTLHKNHNDDTPFDVYGTIMIDDGKGPSPIYNRLATKPQRMHSGGRLILTMPKGYRAIIPYDQVKIKIALSSRFPSISGDVDDQIVDFVTVSDRWNFKKFRAYDIPLQWIVKGAHGYAIVDYVVYRHAISVTVDAILRRKEDSSRINTAHVYGTISARCAKNCSTIIFDKDETETVEVEYGSCIELSSSVVVAPVWVPLEIHASLWNRHPKKKIADGEANNFHPIIKGFDSRVIEGEDDIIDAQVIWRPAYWELPTGSNTHHLVPAMKRLGITRPDQQSLLVDSINRNLLSNLRKSLEQTVYPQLEVLSVSVHNSNKDNFSVWGSIKSEEISFFDHFFFKMEKSAAERMLHNQEISIMFPLKCMKDSLLRLLVDLKDDNDCVVSYGRICWCRDDFDTPLWFDRKLCSVIPGDDGHYSAIYYSIFNGGVQALVKVYLIDRSCTKKYAKVYGSVRSQYSIFEYLTNDDNEYYTRKIYVRRIEDCPLRFYQSKILLSESCVSVPRGSALLIDVDLNVNSGGFDFPPANYTNEILRATAEHVQGGAIFSTEHEIEQWASDENIGLQIEVFVEWKKC